MLFFKEQPDRVLSSHAGKQPFGRTLLQIRQPPPDFPFPTAEDEMG